MSMWTSPVSELGAKIGSALAKRETGNPNLSSPEMSPDIHAGQAAAAKINAAPDNLMSLKNNRTPSVTPPGSARHHGVGSETGHSTPTIEEHHG